MTFPPPPVPAASSCPRPSAPPPVPSHAIPIPPRRGGVRWPGPPERRPSQVFRLATTPLRTKELLPHTGHLPPAPPDPEDDGGGDASWTGQEAAHGSPMMAGCSPASPSTCLWLKCRPELNVSHTHTITASQFQINTTGRKLWNYNLRNCNQIKVNVKRRTVIKICDWKTVVGLELHNAVRSDVL